MSTLQLLSLPSQSSGAPGKTVSSSSLQSPPRESQASPMGAKPSPSPSMSAFTQPSTGSQLSSVHSRPSSQSGGVPSAQVLKLVSQVSTPLQRSPSAHPAS